MVLKRNISSALSFLFNLFLVHSLDYDSCFEPFDVSCIKFSNENIIVVTHNIRCNETTIMSYFVNTKKSTGLRCKSYTACLYSSSLRWKDSYISSGTL